MQGHDVCWDGRRRDRPLHLVVVACLSMERSRDIKGFSFQCPFFFIFILIFVVVVQRSDPLIDLADAQNPST